MMIDRELVQKRQALLQAIRQDRDKLVHAVDNLRDVVQARTDVGAHMAQRPYKWLGAGFLLGLWLGR